MWNEVWGLFCVKVQICSLSFFIGNLAATVLERIPICREGSALASCRARPPSAWRRPRRLAWGGGRWLPRLPAAPGHPPAPRQLVLSDCPSVSLVSVCLCADVCFCPHTGSCSLRVREVRPRPRDGLGEVRRTERSRSSSSGPAEALSRGEGTSARPVCCRSPSPAHAPCTLDPPFCPEPTLKVSPESTLGKGRASGVQ